MRMLRMFTAGVLAIGGAALTVLILLQNQGAGISVGTLAALCFIAFVYDNRQGMFGGEAKAKKVSKEAQRAAVSHVHAMSRLQAGRIRGGTPGHTG
ncbi:hypothetical protein [uncultured Parvibaculum sp.]|uniref:hypothetical protein n=2 Tax=Parvibaculum TaxID=256616 RepID=UPI0030D94B39